MTTTTIAATIDAQIAAFQAKQGVAAAEKVANSTFRESAELAQSAIESGHTAKNIGAAGLAAVAEGRTPKGSIYTSGPAVGFHALTGLALRLSGDLGQVATPYGYADVLPQDVQTLIKKCTQKVARPIIDAAIASGADLPSTLVKLHKAAAKVKAERAVLGQSDDDDNETTDKAEEKSAPTVAEQILAATNILTAAVGRADWTAADVAAATALAKLVAGKASAVKVAKVAA